MAAAVASGALTPGAVAAVALPAGVRRDGAFAVDCACATAVATLVTSTAA